MERETRFASRRRVRKSSFPFNLIDLMEFFCPCFGLLSPFALVKNDVEKMVLMVSLLISVQPALPPAVGSSTRRQAGAPNSLFVEGNIQKTFSLENL